MDSGLSKLWTSLRRLADPTSPHSERLVDCPSCGADLMNPVSWHDVDESTWWMRLRCGACGFVREVEASNEEAQRLEADLDRGLATIAAAVSKLIASRWRPYRTRSRWLSNATSLVPTTSGAESGVWIGYGRATASS